jgi:hypothetical protein
MRYGWVLQERANNLHPVPREWQDRKLTWKAYLKASQMKPKKPRPALTRLTAAAWGFSRQGAGDLYGAAAYHETTE